MTPEFDPKNYKMEGIRHWNLAAEVYHKRYASRKIGPFESLNELLRMADIKKGERVLDIATGTGIVALEAARLGSAVTAIDLSSRALKIAMENAKKEDQDITFIEMDAESLAFQEQLFDIVTCEFALMFFPDSQRALRMMKDVLKENGRIVLSVHGSIENVPYFSIIGKALMKHAPELFPKGRPTPYRFGSSKLLMNELLDAGFRDIKIIDRIYTLNMGTFDEYWNEYMNITVASMKEKLASLDLIKIREECKKECERFTKDQLVFPWQVIIASASK